MKEIDLTLPEWAFLDAHSHEGDILHGRTVILHVRSASVVEILENPKLGSKVLAYNFTNYTNERLTAALHYSATLNVNTDVEYIRENILIPCSKWYIKYCKWEDQGIITSDTATQN